MWNWLKRKKAAPEPVEDEPAQLSTDRPSVVIEFGGDNLDSYRIYGYLPSSCDQYTQDQIDNLAHSVSVACGKSIHKSLQLLAADMTNGPPGSRRVGMAIMNELERISRDDPVIKPNEVFGRIFEQ